MVKKISSAVIKRLPRYYRYLGDLLDNDITRISSESLSERMNVTASQVRQDLNNFGCFGQQGYGYNVKELQDEIKKILGLDKTYNLIVIGAGNIGQAVINYPGFAKRGFNFIALFDIDTHIIGTKINGIKIYDANKLAQFLEENTVDIAVLAMPRDNAEKTVDTIVKSGIKGIWNFSHTDLQTPDSVIVENVHLTDSLMTLSYKLNT